MREKVEAALKVIRPSLQADGGDVELVDVENGIVKVRLTGACGGCPMSQMTLKQGIERRMKEAIPEILSGLLPICSVCQKIRDDKGYWNQIESYIRDHSEAEFTHSIYPECSKKLCVKVY